jgi:hypothetical protein
VSTSVITVVLLQNCIDLQSGQRGCHSGMYATSSEFRNVVVRVQLDCVMEVTEGEDCEPMTFSLMRTDPGVRVMSIECLVLLHWYPELPVSI